MNLIPFAVNNSDGMYICTDSDDKNQVYVFDATNMYSAPYASALALKELNALVAGKMMPMKLSEYQLKWLTRFKRIVEDIDRERISKSRK